MAIENIPNVPEVCSESLLEHFIFKIFPNPPPYYHPLRRRVFVALCPTGPPLGKNPGSAPASHVNHAENMIIKFHDSVRCVVLTYICPRKTILRRTKYC